MGFSSKFDKKVVLIIFFKLIIFSNLQKKDYKKIQMVNMNFHAILIVGPSWLYTRGLDYKLGSWNQT